MLLVEHTIGSVADRWPQAVHDAYWRLVAALIREGVDEEDARYTATQAMLETDKPIRRCLEEQQDEARRMRKDRRD